MPSARQVNWARFRVTAVSLSAVLILSTLVYLLTGGTLLEQKATLYLYIPDATGLASGSPVRVDGIGVGKVRSVYLSGSNDPLRVVKVTMTVERERLASIAADSYAQIASETLVGDKYVDITSGTSPSAIRPNGEILFKQQPELLKTIDLQQFEANLRRVDALLADIEQGRNRVGQFVMGEDLYDDLLNRVADLHQGVRAAASTTSRVGQALYSDRLYRKISQPLVELDRSLARLQSGQGDAGRLLRDPAQYEKLRHDTNELRRSIAELRAGESFRSERSYIEWNRKLTSLIQVVDEFNAGPLFSTSQLYDNLNGAAAELNGSVRDFRRNPRKFLRIKLF